MSWCIYNNIARKQKMLQVHQHIGDLFDLRMPTVYLYRFKRYMAKYYENMYEEILAKILKGSVIHVDETPVNLKNDKGYVWVLTSTDLVYYFYRESRSGGFLKEMLSGFSGVLISDFYTAYDSLDCAHQKCLIHLIRAMNDELLKNPFDSEFKEVARRFGTVLRSIVSTIDVYGPEKKHLKKHKKEVSDFLDSICSEKYTSEIAKRYQERFRKYRSRLFTFLDYNDVFWNNNNAEHAMHWFARYRRFSDALFTERFLRELLILLSVFQTCEYKDINVLEFLISEKNRLRSMVRRPR